MGYFDPYDLWATSLGIGVRKKYYNGELLGKFGAILVAVLDWLIPELSRYLFKAKPQSHPIVIALGVLNYEDNSQLSGMTPVEQFSCLRSMRGRTDKNAWAWGLGFPWMSKNGLYDTDVPFITHTPYVMEALLSLSQEEVLCEEAMNMFHGTWGFLESLRVMHEAQDELALSYAPVIEPRIVINANTYAAFSYALHAVHGHPDVRDAARDRVEKIVRWVVLQQEKNGSWFYYADNDSGNFIDCFHSCFVVKNLLKIKKLLPELADMIDEVVEKGWAFIRNELFDDRAGLCKRFTLRAQRDPFSWDMYDQAEYLGLLVDFMQFDEAKKFSEQVEKKFLKKGRWYCRIDIFGRRWGRGFLRWGIAPYLYHRYRLDQALGENQ